MAKRKRKSYKVSEAQVLLAIHLKELGITPTYEHKFCERDWRFDVCWPEQRLAWEISGGQYSGGHRTGFWSKKEAMRRKASGLVDTPQEEEYLKLNTALMLGWRVMQFTNQQVLDGRAKQFIKEHLAEQRGGGRR
jgi:hypothetical protein